MINASINDKCYLCLRIPFSEVLVKSCEIFGNIEGAKIAILTSQEIFRIYKENPSALCGISKRRILACLFYIIGNNGNENTYRTQSQVCDIMKIHTGRFTSQYRKLIKLGVKATSGRFNGQ